MDADPVAEQLRDDPEYRRRFEEAFSSGAYADFPRYWAYGDRASFARHLSEVRRRLDLVDRAATFRSVAGARALVLGAGFGAEAIALALRGARVVAADLDLEAHRFARHRASAYGVRLRCLCADARDLPVEDGAFDLVFLRQVLEHLPGRDQPRALREAGRALAHGGLLFVDAPNRRDPFDRHDTGLPLLHWLPRRLGRALARAVGREVPTREPGAGGRAVDLHDYPTFAEVEGALAEAGEFRCLTRYKVWRDARDYVASKAKGVPPPAGLRFKGALLAAADALVGLNRFTPIRAFFRKG